MAVDVASKPTLASYNIRPDAFDPKRSGPPNALQTARDRDEAMLGRVFQDGEGWIEWWFNGDLVVGCCG